MICVIGELKNGKILPVTIELLNAGAKIAGAYGEAVTAILLGKEIKEEGQRLYNYGADKVICLEHEKLKMFSTELDVQALYGILDHLKPRAVLIGATSFGRDFGPKLALKFRSDLMTDCTSLEVQEGLLIATRPAFDGKKMNQLAFADEKMMFFSIRTGIMAKAAYSKAAQKEAVVITPELGEKKDMVRLTEVLKEASSKINLPEARIIVAGGRGLKTAENFRLLEELALRFGGEVGCTRPCVDIGWAGPERQIGQTGVAVKPDLYMAFGISGAVQHTTGISGAKYVIAVNNNPKAVIFNHSDYGIVGDAKSVLKAMIEELDSLETNL